MSADIARCSAALLKMCLGNVNPAASTACDVDPPPPLLVLAVLPTLAGEGKGDNPPRKGDLD